MPFAVSQWPNSPDPRTSSFGITGFDFGQVPPWAWVMRTTNALPPFDPLNDGMLWKPAFYGVDFMQFAPEEPLVGVSDQVLEFFGTADPSGAPPGTTMFMQIRFYNTGPLQESGSRSLLYPLAIQVNGPFNMRHQGQPSLLMPDPLTITPAKWNYEMP